MFEGEGFESRVNYELTEVMLPLLEFAFGPPDATYNLIQRINTCGEIHKARFQYLKASGLDVYRSFFLWDGVFHRFDT